MESQYSDCLVCGSGLGLTQSGDGQGGGGADGLADRCVV